MGRDWAAGSQYPFRKLWQDDSTCVSTANVMERWVGGARLNQNSQGAFRRIDMHGLDADNKRQNTALFSEIDRNNSGFRTSCFYEER